MEEARTGGDYLSMVMPHETRGARFRAFVCAVCIVLLGAGTSRGAETVESVAPMADEDRWVPHTTAEMEMPTWDESRPTAALRLQEPGTSDTLLPPSADGDPGLSLRDAAPMADPLPRHIPPLAGTVTTPPSTLRAPLAKPGEEAFNNGCKPPRSWRDVYIPKTLRALQLQVGKEFRVARRGPFLVASDLGESDFAALVDGVLNCCSECLKHDFFDKAPRDIITIYAFGDETSYAAGLKRLFEMKPISPYGHYGHSRRYIVVNYDTGPGTLVHELSHALMAPDFPAAPIWISEGIASLYEQCRVEGDSLKGEVNWRLPELRKALAAGRITPLKELFAMRPGEFRAKNESLHYSESRFFCLYMESQGLLRNVYAAFRDAHKDDPTGLRTVERAFGKPIDQIEAEWRVWVDELTWR